MGNQVINVVDGSDLFMWMDGEIIGHARTHTLTESMNVRETSTKDTKNTSTKGAGRWEVNISCDGLVVFGNGYQRIRDARRNNEPVTLQLGKKGDDGNVDDTQWYAHGDFLVSSFELGAPDGDNATYNLAFEHHSGYDETPGANLLLKANSEGDSAAVFVAGGKKPYTYLWEPGDESTFYVTGKVEGTYKCTVTDDSDPEMSGEIEVFIEGA